MAGLTSCTTNVGGSTMNDGPVTMAPFEEFWNKMKVDLFGTWLGCHYTIPHMIAAGGGSIINASSMFALVGRSPVSRRACDSGSVSRTTV